MFFPFLSHGLTKASTSEGPIRRDVNDWPWINAKFVWIGDWKLGTVTACCCHSASRVVQSTLTGVRDFTAKDFFFGNQYTVRSESIEEFATSLLPFESIVAESSTYRLVQPALRATVTSNL
jgi:hypothetical protein